MADPVASRGAARDTIVVPYNDLAAAEDPRPVAELEAEAKQGAEKTNAILHVTC